MRPDCRLHCSAPHITTPMVALAFSVINSPDDAPQCGRLLAEMVLELAEGKQRQDQQTAAIEGGRTR